jgi:hypothetical protein
MFIDVRTFDLRVIINETPNKWRPVKLVYARVRYRLKLLAGYISPCPPPPTSAPTVFAIVNEITHAVQVNSILVSKGEYIKYNSSSKKPASTSKGIPNLWYFEKYFSQSDNLIHLLENETSYCQ